MSSNLNWYLSPDLKQVVYVENNDLWLADVDWDSMRMINPQQVTQLGIFRRAKLSDLYWFDNHIILYISKVIGVNLTTGEVKEPPLAPFHLEDRISPDNRVVIQLAGQQDKNGTLGVYDIKTDTFTPLLEEADFRNHYWINNEFALLWGKANSAEQGMWLYNRTENSINRVSDGYTGELFGGSPTGKILFYQRFCYSCLN